MSSQWTNGLWLYLPLNLKERKGKKVGEGWRNDGYPGNLSFVYLAWSWVSHALSGLVGLGQRVVFSVCFCFVFLVLFYLGVGDVFLLVGVLFHFPYSIIGFNGPFCCNIFYSLNWWQLLTIKNIWETIFVIFWTSLLG